MDKKGPSLGSTTARNHMKDSPAILFMEEETKALTIHLAFLPFPVSLAWLDE